MRCRSRRSPTKLHTGRDIHTVAKDIVVFDDDVAEIDPYAKLDPAVLGDSGLAVDHCALQFGGAANRVDDAREFRQHPIAGRLHDAPRMLVDLRVDKLTAMRL